MKRRSKPAVAFSPVALMNAARVLAGTESGFISAQLTLALYANIIFTGSPYAQSSITIKTTPETITHQCAALELVEDLVWIHLAKGQWRRRPWSIRYPGLAQSPDPTSPGWLTASTHNIVLLYGSVGLVLQGAEM